MVVALSQDVVPSTDDLLERAEHRAAAALAQTNPRQAITDLNADDFRSGRIHRVAGVDFSEIDIAMVLLTA